MQSEVWSKYSLCESGDHRTRGPVRIPSGPVLFDLFDLFDLLLLLGQGARSDRESRASVAPNLGERWQRREPIC